MALVILTVTVCGIINPYLRTAISLQSFFMLGVGGSFNGFVCARMMKFFGAADWKFAASASAFVLPCYLFVSFVIVEIIEWLERSSSY